MHKTNLRFNFGYLLDASPGTSNNIEFDYPQMIINDLVLRPLRGAFRVTRTSEGIYLDGSFLTQTLAECVRCLDEAEVSAEAAIEELYYYPPSMAPEGSYTLGEDGFIDLGPLFRELALLSRPMQPICRESCKGLCQQCGHNLNLGTCSCEIDDVDPRLAVLKQLLQDDE